MIDKQVVLMKKEQQLNEQETDLICEEKQIEGLEEAYFHHFAKANQLFAAIHELFQETDEAPLFNGLTDEVYRESRKLEESLSSVKKSAKSRRQSVQRQLDEVSKESQKLSSEKEAKAI